ncbi:hypothetical protein DSO57_1023210 [Entomophthora muscae]|uniref:Uncharacterized protein n=1 Tax=Entomophthora muscae TaxID=34485 RepID=A0ACC2SRX2_9FUNG|nr:hypothetical protein DSO57_1023210 [Entomophthora muscae]
MFGRFAYLGHLGHLAIVTVLIGLVMAGLNVGALSHQPRSLFPAKWVPDNCLFMEYKYLWIANICFSLQLDSLIVDQGPTGRVSIQRALSKQDHYQELMTSVAKTRPQMHVMDCSIILPWYCRTADKPLLQLSHGRPPDLPCCLLSLMKPRLSVTPEAYLQKLTQVLINTEAEAYNAKLNIKKKDVDHTSNSHPTLPLYKVSDAVYFYSNRGYGCKNTCHAMARAY